MNRQELMKIAPHTSGVIVDRWLPYLNRAMDRFGIVKREHQAIFIAQTMIESGGLTSMTENLAYRPAALRRIFPGRFTPEEAGEYGYVPGHRSANQQAIANIAYGGRYGNGDRHSGDGWKYRGRGPIQLTFKGNYEACGKAIGIDLVKSPELLIEPEAGSLAAAWFWSRGNKTGKSLNLLADKGDINAISLIVNPGGSHLAERFTMAQRALKILEGAA